MAKLRFFYGAMKGGKSSILIPTAYNLEENGNRVLVVKPKVDNKGEDHILARSGASLKVSLLIDKEDSFFSNEILSLIFESDTILIDEVQFLTKQQIDELWMITKKLDVQVIGFGLRANFQSELFEGSKRLFELADDICEMPIIPLCKCGEKARFNARMVDGKYTLDGEECVIDGSNQSINYIPLCGECYLKEVVLPKKNFQYSKKLDK